MVPNIMKDSFMWFTSFCVLANGLWPTANKIQWLAKILTYFGHDQQDFLVFWWRLDDEDVAQVQDEFYSNYIPNLTKNEGVPTLFKGSSGKKQQEGSKQ